MNIKVIKGMKWTTLSTGILAITQLIQIIVLTNLLTPYDFGIFSMAMVIIYLLDAFSDLGLSSAVIQKKSIDRNQLSTLYWLNILFGILIFLFINVMKDIIATTFYNEPSITEVIYYLSFIFLVMPLGQQYNALLNKKLEFDSLAKIEIYSNIINVFISIILAFWGFGVLSIVFGKIIESTIKTFLYIVKGSKYHKPMLYFNIKGAKELIFFGVFQTGSRLSSYLNSNIDNILIGKFLGAEILGFYNIASNIINIPANKINPMITRVIFPIFSEMHNQSRNINKDFLIILKTLNYINIPLFFGLFIIADELILVFFGDEWEKSAILIKILCVYGLFRSNENLIWNSLISIGKVKVGFYINTLALILQFVFIYFGMEYFGVIGASLSKDLFIILHVFGILSFLLYKYLKISLKESLKSLFEPLICSVAMSVLILIVMCMINIENLYLIIAINSSVGLVSFTIFSFILNQKIIKEFFKERKLKDK